RPTPTRHDDVTITPRTGCGSSPRPHARRVATLGALVALLTTAAGVVLALDGSDAGNGSATVKLAIPVAANSAVRVDLTNTARTLRGHATASGTVTFDTKVVPDSYDVVVSVDSPGSASGATGVDL